ncbi:hypothetical protein [Bacteroides luti]|uniref:hypothetical protein n=1 Tax=Bacteroides luti TaxID=1297750 RepID=UPI0015871F6B|nr:hypothetical protein [Bacteroides luti]
MKHDSSNRLSGRGLNPKMNGEKQSLHSRIMSKKNYSITGISGRNFSAFFEHKK